MKMNSSITKNGPILVNDPQSDLVLDFPHIIRAFKDGRVQRLVQVNWTPPSHTPSNETTVLSKDVVISSETGVLARLYMPREAVLTDNCKGENNKLPFFVFIHGGAYTVGSAFSSKYHGYVTSLVAEAKVAALSVDYRLAPEHPITNCYDDTWAAIQWGLAHRTCDGPEQWLNYHVDFNRVFFVGDCVGGTIATDMAWRVGQSHHERRSLGHRLKKDDAVTLVGIVLVHPFFGSDDTPNPIWELYCPDSKGIADPRLNPILNPDVLAALGCRRVLICVTEKDKFGLRDRGVSYYKALVNSGWEGEAELVETLGETHGFQFIDPAKESARDLLKKVASFLNHPMPV